MTAAALAPDRRPRPQGIERLIERLGLTLVEWSREHAERTRPSHEHRQLLVAQQDELDRRSRGPLSMHQGPPPARPASR